MHLIEKKMIRKAILLNGNQVTEINVDGSHMSPYSHDALGGTPTILGGWRTIILLGLAEPAEHAVACDTTLLRDDSREPGDLKGPLLLTRVDGMHVHDFDLAMYHEWLSGRDFPPL